MIGRIVLSVVQLDDGTGRVLGGSSMEYNVEAGPAKYLVGTEQGVVLSINLRKRKSNDCVVPMDMGSGKHHGPIYSIQRNPTYVALDIHGCSCVVNFRCVGGWGWWGSSEDSASTCV